MFFEEATIRLLKHDPLRAIDVVQSIFIKYLIIVVGTLSNDSVTLLLCRESTVYLLSGAFHVRVLEMGPNLRRTHGLLLVWRIKLALELLLNL